MSNLQEMSFVQALRGAPASVLWAMRIAARPLTNRELQRWTGYSDKIVKQATLKLIDLGCVIALSDYGPWSLRPDLDPRLPGAPPPTLDSGYPFVDSEPRYGESVPPDANSEPRYGESVPPHANSEHPYGDSVPPFGDSDPSSTRSRTSGGGGSFESLNQTNQKLVPPPLPEPGPELEVAETPDSPTQTPYPPTQTPNPAAETPYPQTQTPNSGTQTPYVPAEVPAARDYRTNLQAAREANIEEPSASRIAAMPHVTPDYIREHVRQALEQGRSIGAAIYRIENRWKLPKPKGMQDPGPARPKDAAPDWDFEANVQALLEWRGAEGAARRLAALPHVTPQLVREHYRQAYENNGSLTSTLFSIQRNLELPEVWMHEPRGEGSTEEGINQLAARLGTSGRDRESRDDERRAS